MPPYIVSSEHVRKCSALETHQGSLQSSLPLCSKDPVDDAGGIFLDALPFLSAFVQNEVERILDLLDVRHRAGDSSLHIL